jgi:hypothetical protein
MIELNLQNVEELVFYDSNLHKLLPEFRHLFDQWKLGKTTALKSLAKRSLMDFLKALTPEQVKIIEKHLNTSIFVDRMDYSIVNNYSFCLDDAEEKLNQLGDVPNFCVSRNEDQIYVSFWR